MLDTNEIFVGAQGFAPSVKLEIISIAFFMKWYNNHQSRGITKGAIGNA